MTESSELESLQNCQLDLNREIGDWLESLQMADQMFYNMMTVEIWSIAQTMDELYPGFWAHYMRNRQQIVQQQIQERQLQDNKIIQEPIRRATVSRKPSPFDLSLKKSTEQSNAERIFLFSQDLEQELPKVTRSVRPSLPMTEQSAPLEEPVTPDPHQEQASEAHVADFATVLELGVAQMTEMLSPAPLSPTSNKTNTSTSSVYLSALPHLMRFPVVKVLPFPSETSAAKGMLTVTVACWLTRHFLISDSDSNKPYMLKRASVITLEPGETVICRLGFRLVNNPTSVKVRLVKSLQSIPGLAAAWVENKTRDYQVSGDLTLSEAAVSLTNRGEQPCSFQAGQPFCRLEFSSPIASLPIPSPVNGPSEVGLDPTIVAS